MYRIIINFLLVLILLPCSTAFSAGQKSDMTNISLYWQSIKHVEKFALVALATEGSAEKIGLKEEELQDFMRLRFKKSFEGKEFMVGDDSMLLSLAAPFESPEKGMKYGTVLIQVWTVGEGDPITYHIEILGGNLVERKLFTKQILGYDSKKNMPHIVRNTISELMDDVARFFLADRDN